MIHNAKQRKGCEEWVDCIQGMMNTLIWLVVKWFVYQITFHPCDVDSGALWCLKFVSPALPWKCCPYFRFRSTGISYKKLSLILRSQIPPVELHYLFWPSLLYVYMSVAPGLSVWASSFSMIQLISDLIQSQEFQCHPWLIIEFPFFSNPDFSFDVVHHLLYIYTCILIKISNLTWKV